MCPTFLIGCLPTYAHVGWLSTAMLVVLRLLQGIAIGGEYVSALVFSMEHAPGSKKTISGALMPFGCQQKILPNRLPDLLKKFCFQSGCKGCLRFGLSVHNSCQQKELDVKEHMLRGPFLLQLEPLVVLVWWRFYSIWCLKKQWMTLVGGFAFGWACWLVLWVYFSAARSEFGAKGKDKWQDWGILRHVQSEPPCLEQMIIWAKTRLCPEGNKNGKGRGLWSKEVECCFILGLGLDRFQTQRSSFKRGSWWEIWWLSILYT